MAFHALADYQNHVIGWLQWEQSSLGDGAVVRFPRIWMSSGECRLNVLHMAFGGDNWQGYAFPAQRGSKRLHLDRGSVSAALKELTGRLEIEDAKPHDFRRTGATFLTSERIGIPRFIVSRVLNQVSDRGGAAPVTAIYDCHEYLARNGNRSKHGQRC